MSHKKSGNKKAKAEVPSKMNVPSGLKFLCIMSFLGFIYYLVQDTSQYIGYANFEELRNSANQEAFEIMETKLASLESSGVDVSANGLFKISRMFIYLSIISVLAMVGTALMFFQIRKGYFIYAFFQLLYVLLPVILFAGDAFTIMDKRLLIIPLIYVALFTTQLKHLTR
jgi:hypothetical protein